MYYFVVIPEVVLGVIALLFLCLIWGGGTLISQFWTSLLYWGFFILFIPTLVLSLILYLVGNEEGNNPPVYKRLLSFCCAYLMPFITMLIVKKQIVDKYIYDKNTEFPIKGTVLLTLIGAIILMVVVFMLINKVNVLVSVVIWGIILLASPTIKDNIVEQIAKHEIVSVISFQDKESKNVYKATGNYYYNSGMLGDITRNKVEIINEKGVAEMLNRDDMKVYDYISRYDVLMQTESDICELLIEE